MPLPKLIAPDGQAERGRATVADMFELGAPAASARQVYRAYPDALAGLTNGDLR
jgi:hypothetical protein